MHTTCLPSREQAQGRKLTDRLEPRTGEEETLEKIKTSHLGFRKRPAFGRGRDGGGGQVGEWPPQPQAPNLARLFSPGCSPPGPDSSLTRLGPNLPSALRRAPPPSPGALGFLPAQGPRLGRAEEGWHFLAGPWATSLAPGRSDSALTDRHQMLFRAAPRSVRSFRFSTDRRKQGLGGGCRRHEPPAPGGGWGTGPGWLPDVTIWSFANRGGWWASPPQPATDASAHCLPGAGAQKPCPVRCSFPTT